MLRSRAHFFAVVGGVLGCQVLLDFDDPEGRAEPEAGDADTRADAAADATSRAGWCGQRPDALFCDDFDDLALRVEAKWYGADKMSGGGNVAGVSHPHSPPRALRSSVPEVVGKGKGGNARVAVPVDAGGAPEIRFRFSLRVAASGWIPPRDGGKNGYNTPVSVFFEEADCATRSSGGKDRAASLVFAGKNLSLNIVGLGGECADGGDDFVSFAIDETPPSVGDGGAWSEYEIIARRTPCADRPAASGAIVVRRDGAELACHPTGVDPTIKARGLELKIGAGVDSDWGATALDFDNVEIVAVPEG